MKKTLLNWTGQVVAVVAISTITATTVFAQTSGGLTVDQAFARELKLVEGLKVYNDQLAKQLKGQQQAKAQIRNSIVKSKDIEPQVVPLMKKMLVALEQFIKTDLPFKLDERLESIGDLKALMVNSEATTSDRFRNIMDIYTVETEYGNTYEAYPGSVDIDGTDTPVDILRVGRLALYYQTKDKKTSGMWDRTNKSWKVLPDSNNRSIRTAIKVAAKTIAPELMTLPISAPEGV